ncbi:MAG: hypothetical protein EPN37_04570 [Chitinophagaceae bacterium]|nr:MAG: hypothetical protein EPN37_04570 [Chitinophagaceae bacterium]
MSNKRIDFSQLGGFPLTQDALDFMQQSYRNALVGVAQLAGDAVILSGMIDNGTAVTDGWILYNGELLPFLAGNKQTYFIIEDITGTDQFQDNTIRIIYHTRQARFGSGTGQIAYSALVRLNTVLGMQTNYTSLSNALTAVQNSLNAHIANTLNPHGVTKVQVGLGNLPNAKSDAINLNDTNTLATSAAVFALANMILLTGSIYLGDIPGPNDNGAASVTVNLANAVTGAYIVIGSIRSAGTNVNNDNNVIWVVRSLTANSFVLSVRELFSSTQDIYFDYALIKVS